MMRPISFCLIAILLIAGAGDIRAQKIVYPASRMAKIPVELFDGIVYVKVLLNDEFEARLMLDTGTDSLSVVSTELAESMGVLSPDGDRNRSLGSRRKDVPHLYGTRLKIEGIELSGYEFIALPLQKLQAFWGRKLDGILGGNILKEFVVTIDYQNRHVILADRLADKKGKPKGYCLPMSVMGTTPLVQVHVVRHGDATPITGRFIVDTGARQSFFNTPFVRRHALLKQSGRLIENITGYGLGGLIVEKVGRVASIDLGGARLLNPVMQISANDDGPNSSSLFDGIIGADLLSRFTAVFDFFGQNLYLEPNRSFAEPFLYDMSGICFSINQTEQGAALVRIVYVVADSPAAEAGVLEGDVLVRVDGKPAAAFTMPELKAKFKRAGEKVNLDLERDGKAVKLTLVLTPYI